MGIHASFSAMAVLAAVTLLLTGILFAQESAAGRLLIRGGTVYDGGGAPGVRSDVLIMGDSIIAVGEDLDAEGATIIDAAGMVVCPGFIDVHNHTHESHDAPDDENSCLTFSQVGQGITTAVVGMDGHGEVDIAKYAEKIRSHPRAINICRLVGHSAARYASLGREARPATDAEIEKMAASCATAMDQGAFGFSSGLEGRRVSFASTEELIECAKAVAPHGGYYETHLRNEDVKSLEALEEAIRICREGGNIPLSVSHIKVSLAPMLGKAEDMLVLMRAARKDGMTIHANWRPSIAWSSDLKMIDEGGAREAKALDDQIRKYWPDAGAYCHKCPSHPDFVGGTLADVAAEWGVTPGEALLRIWDVIPDMRFEFNAMIWPDKKAFLMDPFVCVSSDGWEGDQRIDPLSWGCFPILFGKMVRQWQWLPMETAVYKCTGLPRQIVGLGDRGLIFPGMKADVVAFDPVTISGEEHWDKAGTPPVGIKHVFVNGVMVMDHGEHTGAHPGLFLSTP